MAVKPRPKRTVAAKPKAAPKPKVNVNSFLAGISQPKTKTTKKKDDKPTIVLTGKASELLRLQQAKAAMKVAEGTVKGLEGELFDDIEQQRLAISEVRKNYIGSIKVTATGTDEDGKTIDPGIASYYIQNKYTGFNFFDPSEDEDLQEQYDKQATLKHEAIHAIMDAFNPESDDDAEEGDADAAQAEEDQVSYEEAEAMLDERMEIEHGLSLDPRVLECDASGNPLHPEKIAILQEHFGDFLRSVSKAKPTKAFHESSNYDPTERTIMEALSNIGLVKRYKAVLKPSGAPKQ